jgi:hypothetical protein
MVELLRSNDLVYLSWVEATLAAAGIELLLVDQHTSALEGSIAAIPRRLLVEERDLLAAQRALRDASALLDANDQ